MARSDAQQQSGSANNQPTTSKIICKENNMFGKITVKENKPVVATIVTELSSEDIIAQFPRYISKTRSEAIQFEYAGKEVPPMNGPDLVLKALAHQYGRGLAMKVALKPHMSLDEENYQKAIISFDWCGRLIEIGVEAIKVAQMRGDAVVTNKEGAAVMRTVYGHFDVSDGEWVQINKSGYSIQPYATLANTITMHSMIDGERNTIKLGNIMVPGWNNDIGWVIYRRPFVSDWASLAHVLLIDLVDEAAGGEIVIPPAYVTDYAFTGLATGYNSAFKYFTTHNVACVK